MNECLMMVLRGAKYLQYSNFGLISDGSEDTATESTQNFRCKLAITNLPHSSPLRVSTGEPHEYSVRRKKHPLKQISLLLVYFNILLRNF